MEICNFKLWHPHCVSITVYKEWYQVVKHYLTTWYHCLYTMEICDFNEIFVQQHCGQTPPHQKKKSNKSDKETRDLKPHHVSKGANCHGWDKTERTQFAEYIHKIC